jgi:hypothetical protein
MNIVLILMDIETIKRDKILFAFLLPVFIKKIIIDKKNP